MYAWPILLPAQSNREDLLRTISLFDDDTGQAIDVSGRTLAAPGDFTAANWVVTSGTIVTASVTQLTIKDYPFGNEMQAIACTVGVGLAILAGAPVTIKDAATGKNTMTGYVTSYAPATGALVCQIGSAFLLEIRTHAHNYDYSGYASSSYIGTDDCSLPIIQASLGNGISVIDVGVIQVRIPANPGATLNTAQLRHKTYNVGLTMFDGYDTRQLMIGRLPILNGYVSSQPLPQPVSNPFGLP